MNRLSRLFLIACAMLIALPLQAQRTFGLVGGISTGKMLETNDGDNVTADDKGLMSLVLGVSMRSPMKNALSFAPEAIYVAKGYSDEDSDGKVSMSYIEIPILFRYGFETTGTIKPFLTAGPAVGLQLSCTYTEADGDDHTCEEIYGEDDTYKKLDAGIVVGGGVTRAKLSLSVRYDLGLFNTSKTDGWVSKHRALMILLGFQL